MDYRKVNSKEEDVLFREKTRVLLNYYCSDWLRERIYQGLLSSIFLILLNTTVLNKLIHEYFPEYSKNLVPAVMFLCVVLYNEYYIWKKRNIRTIELDLLDKLEDRYKVSKIRI